MDKPNKEIPLKEKMLKEIFNELQKNAYDLDFHGYHYKKANQIIRHYFEILIKGCHEAELKEELIKFRDYCKFNYNTLLVCTDEQIDYYLKKRNNG